MLKCFFAVALLMVLYPTVAPLPALAQDDTKPRCGVFFDKWDVPGAPQGVLIMAGIGRELMAAQDCLTNNKTPTACEHYRRIQKVLDTRGAAVPAMSRSDLDGIMKRNNCTP